MNLPTKEQESTLKEFLKKHKQILCSDLPSSQEQEKYYSREIVVRDIPLGTTKEKVKRHFYLYADIKKTKLTAHEKWQMANIIYKEKDSAKKHFQDLWFDIFKKDSVRIFLAENFENCK